MSVLGAFVVLQKPYVGCHYLQCHCHYHPQSAKLELVGQETE